MNVARSSAHCRCLRHCVRLRWCLGVRGYYDVRVVGLQGGNSRPPWKSPPGVAASMVFGSCFIILQTLTQMRGATALHVILKSCGHGANAYGDAVICDGCSSEVFGPMQI